MSRIFFNTAGDYVGNIDNYLEIAARSQPTSAVVINNLSLTNKIRQVSPKTKVIYREKTNDMPSEDADVWLSVDPKVYAERLMRNGNKLNYLYILNEPPIGDRAKDLSHWLVECAKEILKNNFAGVVLGNFAVGNIELSHVKRGDYDELITYCSQNSNRVFIGLHEGSGGFIPVGCGLINFDDILNWKSPHPIIFENVPKHWFGKYTEQFYHVLRYHWLQVRAAELGLAKLKFAITEFCIDNLSDILQSLLIPLQNLYHIPQLRGYKTYAAIWSDLMHLPLSEAYIKQIAWADKQYPSDIIGINIFCWWNNFQQWQTYDVSDDNVLHEWLKTYKGTLGEDLPVNNFPSENDTRWKEATVAPKATFFNIRSEPKTKSNSVKVVDKTIKAKILFEEAVSQPDGLWLPIMFVENNWTVAGYVRNDVIRMFENLTIDTIYDPDNSQSVVIVKAITELIKGLE